MKIPELRVGVLRTMLPNYKIYLGIIYQLNDYYDAILAYLAAAHYRVEFTMIF